MNLEEKTVRVHYIYKGRIVNLRGDTVLLPNGKEALREVVEHSGGVCVVALTDDDRVLFVKQYRYPYKEEVLEIPAGKINEGESPEECGKRELKEETGAIAEIFLSLGVMYPSPGYSAEIIYIYLAKGLRFENVLTDEDEFLENSAVPFDEALKKAASGEIKDAKTVTGLFRAAVKTGRLNVV